MNATNSRVIAAAAAAAATTLALAGCAAAGSTAGAGIPDRPGTAQPVSSATHPNHAPRRLAKRLIEAAVAPPSAHRSRQSSTKQLRQPPAGPAGHDAIVRIRWWRVDKPWHAAYSWVVHHQAKFLTNQSSGATGGPALRDNERYADFTPAHLPAGVNSATLTIAVQPLTRHTAAIAAYAVVVRQSPRPADENVPRSLATAALVGKDWAAPGSKPVITKRTVTGSTAQKLVSDFDSLVVRPDEGPIPCPISLSTQTATFATPGHTWVVHNGFCDQVTVILNHHRLPALQATEQFTNDLNAALGQGSDNSTDVGGNLGTRVRQPLVRNTPIR
jgi:hypothetical protein